MNFPFLTKKISSVSIETQVPKESNALDINGKLLADKSQVSNPTLPATSTFNFGIQNQRFSYKKNASFINPEYDLVSISNAVALDGLLHRGVEVYVEQILKNGAEFVSKDDAAQLHVNNRLKEIENLTNFKMYELMNVVARQLVTYANAFIIKVRGAVSVYAKEYKVYNKTLKPVIGLFVVDAVTMKFIVDVNGNVIGYRQQVSGDYVDFKKEDVIHISYNKLPGAYSGFSPIHPILDDVRALRKLEEEIEILGFQYAIPLYLYKVGSDTHPAQPGEVDMVNTKINNSPTYGIMVVPHTHDMKAVTNNNDPVEIMKFVDYFKRRVFAGLGLSPISMGEVDSANRNTAESLDISMQSITKSYQNLIRSKLEQELVDEILLDGGFNINTTSCELKFPEIDLESQIKKETNIIQKYLNGLITRTEARLEMDYEAVTPDEDTYLRLDKIPLIEATAAAKASMAPTPAAKTNASLSRPKNQHGTFSGRPRTRKDSINNLIDFSINLSDTLIQNDGYKSALNRNKYTEKLNKQISSGIMDHITELAESYKEFYHLDCDVNKVCSDSMVKEFIKLISSQVKHKVERLSAITTLPEIKIQYTIDSIKDSLDLYDKIENLVRILILKESNISSILYKSDGCEYHTDWTVNIKDVNLLTIPPFRRNCKCKVVYGEEE